MQSVRSAAQTLLMLTVLLPGLPAWANGAQHDSLIEAHGIANTDPVTADLVVGNTVSSDAGLLPPIALEVNGMGSPVNTARLDNYRGGTEISNLIIPKGLVQDNAAVNVATGTNSITGGAFSNASGFPMAIQNSGANVLIQNAMIVNIQLQ